MSKRDLRLVLITGLVLLLIGGAAGFGFARFTASQRDEADARNTCPGETIIVSANPEVAGPLMSELDDRECTSIKINPVESWAAGFGPEGTAGSPDVWIPDSATWATRSDITPKRLVKSVATSPVVLLSRNGVRPNNWTDTIQLDDFVLGDPINSTASGTPLLASITEQGQTKAAEAAVPLAQKQMDSKEILDDTARAAEVSETGRGVTPASEQLALTVAPSTTMTTPRDGTMFLDYPALITASPLRTQRIQPMLDQLREVLTSPSMQQRLREAGFRAADRKPIDGGVGQVAELATPPDPAVQDSLGKWRIISMPINSLAVIDVSGSMDFPGNGGTRMELLERAAINGVKLFPGGTSLGGWIFSEKLDGDKDYLKLVPMRRLDARTPQGLTQRQEIIKKLNTLSDRTQGGTGLYDTTLAAYKYAQRYWRKDAVNSIMLLTDGANDDPGSIELPALLKELKRLQDPEKPIIVIGIGITNDADEASLKAITDVTGGVSLISEDPANVEDLFKAALGHRDSSKG